MMFFADIKCFETELYSEIEKHHYKLPENYIKFLLLCDNNPQKYCKDYGDISLYSLEELSDEREIYEMNKSLIVTDGGNLLSQFITPEYCTFFHDFFLQDG